MVSHDALLAWHFLDFSTAQRIIVCSAKPKTQELVNFLKKIKMYMPENEISGCLTELKI